MLAPPGYPKTTSPPSRVRTSQTICAPVLCAGSACGLSLGWTAGAGGDDMRTSGAKKKPHTVSGAGARFLPETLLRSGRRPAPAANERKQSDDAKKERGAKLQRGGGQDVGARGLRVHRLHG